MPRLAPRLLASIAVVAGALVAPWVASPIAREAHVPHSRGLAEKKDAVRHDGVDDDDAPAPVILATLVQTHTGERVLLDDEGPPLERFDALLGDRTTGAHGSLDPRLLDLLRQLARGVDDVPGGASAPARIELVSGYRSAKLNEMLRKKGHHVASHSQHSLGHAVDFRLIPASQTAALEPARVRERIRALGWQGGVGIYPTANDRFVHADVGPNRNWMN
jgi:uncharacterized protein YcbK (DUF882 family)